MRVTTRVVGRCIAAPHPTAPPNESIAPQLLPSDRRASLRRASRSERPKREPCGVSAFTLPAGAVAAAVTLQALSRGEGGMLLVGAASGARSATPRPRGGSAAAATTVGSTAAPRSRHSCGSVSNIGKVIGGGIQAAGRRPRVADW
eukprot:356698-Chlamydomonas_euryale.AAC.6